MLEQQVPVPREPATRTVQAQIILVTVAFRDGELSVLAQQRSSGETQLPRTHITHDEGATLAGQRFLTSLGIAGKPGIIAMPFDTSTLGDALMLNLGILTLVEPGGGEDETTLWVPMDRLEQLPSWDGEFVEKALDLLPAAIENPDMALALLPAQFTLPDLRKVYEAIWGKPIEPKSFMRKILLAAPSFLIETGRYVQPPMGSPARLYRRGRSIAPRLRRPEAAGRG